jgi:hypothetical protein
VIIRGRGIEETLTFSIIQGATAAVALPFENLFSQKWIEKVLKHAENPLK